MKQETMQNKTRIRNKHRCPKCDVGKLSAILFRTAELTGRNWKYPHAKICQVCSTIYSKDEKITFVYQNG